MGVPLNHQFLFGMFPYKPSSNYWGTPMTMETSISIHFYTHHLARILYNHIIQYYTLLITFIHLHPSYIYIYPSYTHHIPIIYPSYTHHIPISHSSLGPVCFSRSKHLQAVLCLDLLLVGLILRTEPWYTTALCFWSETTGESMRKIRKTRWFQQKWWFNADFNMISYE